MGLATRVSLFGMCTGLTAGVGQLPLPFAVGGLTSIEMTVTSYLPVPGTEAGDTDGSGDGVPNPITGSYTWVYEASDGIVTDPATGVPYFAQAAGTFSFLLAGCCGGISIQFGASAVTAPCTANTALPSFTANLGVPWAPGPDAPQQCAAYAFDMATQDLGNTWQISNGYGEDLWTWGHPTQTLSRGGTYDDTQTIDLGADGKYTNRITVSLS